MDDFLASLCAASGVLGSGGLLAVLQGYFDESGHLNDQADHVIFGGVAGRLDEVSVFSRKWRELLGSDVDHIHMRDAMRCEGAFRGWKDKEDARDELLIEAARLIQSESAMLVVSDMDKQDFRSLPRDQQKKLKNPTYGGFEICIRGVIAQFPTHDLHVWCDESEEYASTCLKIYQRMKSLNTQLASRLPSITFANDEKYPGLQAADMVVYSSYVTTRDGPSAPKVVQEIYTLLSKERHGKQRLVYSKGATLGGGILEL